MVRLAGLVLLTSYSIVVAAEPPLEAKLKLLAVAHKGKVAVMVKHLDTGEVTEIDADTVMPTASLIKVAVMVEAYWQAEEKKVDLAEMITLTKDDKVQGAGILTQHFSDGMTMPLRDAVRLMIVYSDNTATNMVLDKIGIKNVNDRMESLGLKNTKINAKVFKGSTTSVDPERTKHYGLGSTTAREMASLMEMIHAGKVVTPEACALMKGHLFANDDKEQMVRFLPAGVKTAHKTGAVSASRTDAGIIYIPDSADTKKKQTVAICVLTNDNEDKRWIIDNGGQVTIARIAREVHDWYGKKKE